MMSEGAVREIRDLSIGVSGLVLLGITCIGAWITNGLGFLVFPMFYG